ncbi:HAD-IC family P-type ATPase [Streptococcus suis]
MHDSSPHCFLFYYLIFGKCREFLEVPIDTFVFDKTGTITDAVPSIQQILPFEGYSEEEVLQIAACLEEHVYHPIAQAVVEKAEEEGIEHPEMHNELYHIASKGIVSSIEDEKVMIGNLGLLEDESIQISREQFEAISIYEKQYNLLYLGYKGKLIAIFCIDINLRQEAKAVLVTLKEKGKNLVLLTGDTRYRTKKIVAQLPFDEVLTDMTPQTKHQYIVSKQNEGKQILMVGDGLNDSAALSASAISVSMGDGADLSKQVSDILLLSDSLVSLLIIQKMVEEVEKRINTNVYTAVSINSSLILFGLFGILPSKTLALVHNLTTFGIVFNSFNLKHPLS